MSSRRELTPSGRRQKDTALVEASSESVSAKHPPCMSTKNGALEQAAATSIKEVREYRTLLGVALLLLALLFMAIPLSFCFYNRLELADNYRQRTHGQTESQCHECEDIEHNSTHGALTRHERWFGKDVVSSALNGIFMMSAVVLSGIGADVPARGIFAVGISNLLVNAFSTGFNKYMLESSREAFAQHQMDLEYQEVRTEPAVEIHEMVSHYRRRGLSEADANNVASVLSKYEHYWVQHMMSEELGLDLPRGYDFAALSGFAVFFSFICFGMVPVLGLAVSVVLRRFNLSEQWYRPQFSTSVAIGISTLVLPFMGIVLSHVTGSQYVLFNSLSLVFGGSIAAICAVSLGRLLNSDMFFPSAQYSSQSTSSLPQDASDAAVVGLSSLRVQKNSPEWPFMVQLERGLGLLLFYVATFVVLERIHGKMNFECFRVFAYGWLTCITTGFGAFPFMIIGADHVSERSLAFANTVASGMMLSASAGMVVEAHEHCGYGDWQILVGLILGCAFILLSQHLLGNEEEAGMEALHVAWIDRRHFRKAMLIFTVMFFHSAAEGIAVGVSFDKQVHEKFGLYISLLLAVHNMPEGLAVALVLVPRGISASMASLIATCTSIPQPLLALTAFVFVDAFQCLLPLGLSFAAGAMVYVSLHELLAEAVEQLGYSRTAIVVAASFSVMLLMQWVLHRLIDL